MDDVQKNADDTGKKVETAPKAEDQAPKADAKKTDDTVIGEALNKKPEHKEPKMVPEADLLAVKKTLEGKIETLQKQVEAGGSKKEANDAIAALKKKWPDNSEFIDELSTAILGSVKGVDEKELDDKIEAKVKPLTEKEKQQDAKDEEKRINSLIDEHYAKTLDALPEFKELVTKDAFKALVQAPQNANKTFTRIVEETFGHLVKGKPSIDETKPGGGKDPAEIDYNRAAKDNKYFNEIMADPDMKKEYNSTLEKRLKL